MPAGFFALLLVPIWRYRHGCDPSKRHLRLSFPPLALDSELFLLACPSNLFTFSLVRQQLSLVEPFLNPLRLTPVTEQKYLELPNMGIKTERNG